MTPSECKWCTFNDGHNDCLLYSECKEINATACPTCSTNQVECANLQCDIPGLCKVNLISE